MRQYVIGNTTVYIYFDKIVIAHGKLLDNQMLKIWPYVRYTQV